MLKPIRAILALGLLLTQTSCVEEPKTKLEAVTSAPEYEKIIDDIVGPGTINPLNLQVGQRDIRVESLQIANSMIRERYRRQLSVVDVQKSGNQTQYKFNVSVIQRDSQGNPQPPVTTQRTLVLLNGADGTYQFFGDGTEFTVFSWDYLIGLRGFCSNFETEASTIKFTCSSVKIESAIYQPLKIPARKISLNRAYEIRDKKTGTTESGKLRYVITVGTSVQEISKVLSFCVEGLQKIDNSVYQLLNCNSVENID
jgi:hypothetical protein